MCTCQIHFLPSHAVLSQLQSVFSSDTPLNRPHQGHQSSSCHGILWTIFSFYFPWPLGNILPGWSLPVLAPLLPLNSWAQHSPGLPLTSLALSSPFLCSSAKCWCFLWFQPRLSSLLPLPLSQSVHANGFHDPHSVVKSQMCIFGPWVSPYLWVTSLCHRSLPVTLQASHRGVLSTAGRSVCLRLCSSPCVSLPLSLVE